MNLVKSTGTFGFFTIISRLLGYLRDILIAIFLGTGMLADAFFVAFRIPNTFRRLFAEGTFNAAFVPSYSSEIIKGKKQSNKFANDIFNLLFLGLLFLTIVINSFIFINNNLLLYSMKNICDWNNCFDTGEYKAPIEKDNSKRYRLLCLAHVKEFNKNWNYFKGMDDEQVFDFLKSDMTWHKPTQSFSSSDNFFKVLWNNTLKDEFDKTKLRGEYNHMNQFKFDANDIKAFSILGVSVGQKWEQIQDQFKTLVKKFHPDINLGNKEYEEKLKLITLAYTQLKNTYKEKIDT